MLSFRKSDNGWAAFGPADEVKVGPCVIERKDGQKVPKTIERVSAPFTTRNGRTMAYGYLAAEAPRPINGQGQPAKSFTPTEEQAAIIEAFLSGRNLKVQAYAGTGKTTVLKAAAERTERKGRYVAFNKSIVTEAMAKMPANVEVSTAHALALGYTEPAFRDRLQRTQKHRNEPLAIAQRFEIPAMSFKLGEVDGKILKRDYRPGSLAGIVMKALRTFCMSGDDQPMTYHFPLIEAIEGGEVTGNNNRLRSTLLPALRDAWADTLDPKGFLPYRHAYYLKAFALQRLILPIDFLLVDEAQDLSPVLLSIVERQLEAGVQVIAVGDDYQAINGFTGAVNALQRLAIEDTLYLTKSWRFGPAVAGHANMVLTELGALKPLVGNDAIADSIGPLDQPRAVLSRTNAGAIRRVLDEIKVGRKPKLIGAVKEIVDFCKAALDLQAGRGTEHPELSWASSWDEVQTYVTTEDGEDMKLLVDVIDEFGAQVIISALDGAPKNEDDADIIVSTAHKVKGREWPTVQLDHGIGRYRQGQPPDESELQLLYVAVTRGQEQVDVEAVDFFRKRA